MAGIAQWLENRINSQRWVLTTSGRWRSVRQEIIGHVELELFSPFPPIEQREYWQTALGAYWPGKESGSQGLNHWQKIAVVKRLGVAPEFQRCQAGKRLVTYARQQAWALNRDLFVLVIADLYPARKLYQGMGADLLGSFIEQPEEVEVLCFFFPRK